MSDTIRLLDERVAIHMGVSLAIVTPDSIGGLRDLEEKAGPGLNPG
jgi:hypothetical protein